MYIQVRPPDKMGICNLQIRWGFADTSKIPVVTSPHKRHVVISHKQCFGDAILIITHHNYIVLRGEAWGSFPRNL